MIHPYRGIQRLISKIPVSPGKEGSEAGRTWIGRKTKSGLELKKSVKQSCGSIVFLNIGTSNFHLRVQY